jgi:hypothetical protein
MGIGSFALEVGMQRRAKEKRETTDEQENDTASPPVRTPMSSPEEYVIQVLRSGVLSCN